MKNYLYLFFYIVMSLFLSSCSNHNSHLNKAEPIEKGIMDSGLREAYQKADELLIQHRTVLTFNNGMSANNCRDYLKLSVNHDVQETVNNQIIKSEYLVCDAVNILAGAKSFTDNSVVQMGDVLLHRLDIRSFPNSFSRMADDNAFTLYKMFPNQLSANTDSVSYESDEWFFSLHIVAIADLNSNVNPDWIVYLSDESKTGNYRNYATLIVYDTQSNEPLKGVLYKVKE